MNKNVFCVSILFLFFSCSPNMEKPLSKEAEAEQPKVSKSIEEQPVDNLPTSENSLDWEGVYEGVLPCADCEGVEVQLSLDSSGKFVKESMYLGKSDSIYRSVGTIEWGEEGSSIQLLDSNLKEESTYFVGENVLIQLDQDGKKIESSFSSNYRLNKVRVPKASSTQFFEKKWSLKMMRGKVSISNAKINLFFEVEGNRVSGFGGCNRVMGAFELNPKFSKIRFSNMLSTQKACEEMEVEQEFLKLLHSVDNYTLSEDTLYLNKARMAPLMMFTVERAQASSDN